jgi:hypothetical protein
MWPLGVDLSHRGKLSPIGLNLPLGRGANKLLTHPFFQRVVCSPSGVDQGGKFQP